MDIPQMRERIAELEAELRYRNEVIETLTAHEAVFPREWRLSPTETRLLACMAQKNGAAAMEALITAVYWMRDEPERPEEVIKVTIGSMRKKLRPYGIEIHVEKLMGYRVDPRTALRLKTILAGEGDPVLIRRHRRKRRDETQLSLLVNDNQVGATKRRKVA